MRSQISLLYSTKQWAGFATFFTIFEMSRSAGSMAKDISAGSLPSQLLPAINGIVLVTGGVGGLRSSRCTR